MSVRFRSVATDTNTAGVSESTVVITKPSQTVDGDLMIAVLIGASTATVTPPAGWVELGLVAGTGVRATAYKKIASSEGADYTFTFSAAGAVNGSIASFLGGHDVLMWASRDTTTTDPASGRDLDAARDAVGWSVYGWQNTTANATVTWSAGAEKHDIAAVGATSTRRGQSGAYYGPSDVTDIVNAGDTLTSPTADPSQAPLGGVYMSFLVGDKAPDAETWSSTNGDFDVELKLDVNEVNSTGSITSKLRGDITGSVSTSTSSTGTSADARDGLSSTQWTTSAATGWIQYDFGASVTKTVRRYRITSGTSEARDAMNWTLQGSNNGTDFTIVDTRTNQSFASRGEAREFKLNGTAAAYRYYRLDITANASSGGDAAIQIAEFRLSDIDVWEGITAFVQEESKIRITRGLQGASGRSDFSRAYVELKNTDGRFSLRNQAGKYYGALQRNNEIRISKAFGTKSLQLQGDVELAGTDVAGDGARCPLTSTLAITGDMEIRIDLELESWRDEQALCGIASPVSVTSPWRLNLLDDGTLQLKRYDGTSERTYTSTEAVPMAIRQSIKVTVDVNNGASGSDVAFYYATSIGGSYTQIGSTVTVTTTANTSYSGGALCVGHVGSQTERGIHGRVYNFELYTGIAGSAVTDVDFTALANGAHSWTDSNSNRWITVNNSVVSNRRYRFHGEVPEWPMYWDPTGTWVAVSATGAGVQRRLERGNAPLSAMRRYHTKGIVTAPASFERHADPVAYWAMEDETNAFTLASGLPGKPAMTIYGRPDFEGDDGEKFKESGKLIKINSAKFGGRISDTVDGYADIRFLFYAPTAPTNDANILTIYSTGSIKKWELDFQATDLWRIRGYNEDAIDTGTPTVQSSSIPVTTTGEAMHVKLLLEEIGSDVRFAIDSVDVWGTVLGDTTTTFSSVTLGQTTRVNVNDDSSVLLSNAYLGHLAVYGPDSPTYAGTELNAHHYETAGNRIKRLCDEEGIEFRHVGALDESAFLGHQESTAPFSQMSSAAVSDEGYLIDPLDAFGIEYRTVRSVLNQAAHLTLSYTGGELSGELRPVGDDAHITNDFTASRGAAGSARYQRTDGPLSVNNPPTGVGPYENSQSYDLAHEGQCIDLASWQVHKGTLDEERYPRIELALENLRITASTSLTESILNLDVGKRIDITNTPDFLPADDIRQTVVGYEEWFDNFQHSFKLNTIPERIYETARYDEGDRFETDTTTLYQDVTAAASSFDVVNESGGMEWSDTATDFDIVIDGERITVTSIAYTSTSFSTDSFNRADSATNLGSTDGGTVSAWQQDAGTWGISSNQAYISVAANGLATIPGSADFEEVSVTVAAITAADAYILFRFTDSSNRWRWGGTVGAAAHLDKTVAGVTTAYTADVNGTDFVIAAGDILKARAHGSIIEVFRNGRLAMTLDDTFNESAIRVGMQIGANTATRMDSFVWRGDNPRQTFTVTRGVGPSVGAYHKAGAEVKLYKTPFRGI